jgi:hypothetical protein
VLWVIGSALIALVANPAAAIVTALGALGLPVYNNWAGIQSFFVGFADGIRNAVGLIAGGWVSSIASGLQSVWNALSGLLGPLQAPNAEWQAWSVTVGGIVAGAINTVASGIDHVIGLFRTAYEWATSLGNSIASLGGAQRQHLARRPLQVLVQAAARSLAAEPISSARRGRNCSRCRPRAQ